MGKNSSKMVINEKNAVGFGAGAGFTAGLLSVAIASYVFAKKKLKTAPKNNGPLLEYSVVYTDRALNLMSAPFMQIMREISMTLKEVYNCQEKGSGLAIIPGSGSYAMEAVARQFGSQKKCFVIRNGYFSYRWSDIFHVTKILHSEETIMYAEPESKETATPSYQPPDIDEVEARIRKEKPAVVFAPHVETALGIILPVEYMKRVAKAVHEVGGIFVLDCIASGTIWVDMENVGIDVLISAPQKGWSGPACCGIVLMSKRAMQKMNDEITIGQSFACNLKQWTDVMQKYENNGFRYYTTLPTDALRQFHHAMMETKKVGWENARSKLQLLGSEIRKVLTDRGFVSVAAEGYQSPGVVVSYANCNAPGNIVQSFKRHGLQIAGGVNFKLNHNPNVPTFRLGLFGLDKIANIPKTVNAFRDALEAIISECPDIRSDNIKFTKPE